MKEQLRVTAAETAKLSGAVLEGMIEVRESLARAFDPDELVLFNATEFILLLEHDLACLVSDMLSHAGTLRGNLYARLVVLTIHESTRTMLSVIAKSFRESLVGLISAQHPDADDVLRAAHSSCSRLFAKSNAQFGAARDGIVAHRDEDPAVRTSLLRAVQEQAVTALAMEMLATLISIFPLIASYTRILRGRMQGPAI